MHFDVNKIKQFRYILFPFSLVVCFYIQIRNWLYDKKLLHSVSFNLPVICVGNLNVGGTGKSPMTEWLLRFLLPNFEVATISRGYKRKTKGYILANSTTTALEIGDEPMQFYTKFPKAIVAVDEDRIHAIPQLLQDNPQAEIILLDDAFQHRPLIAGFSIVLTDYNDLFWNDHYLPVGGLRDSPKSLKRAHIVLITKCPDSLTIESSEKLVSIVQQKVQIPVFFATLSYGSPYHLITNQTLELSSIFSVVLFCGIANPQPILDYLSLQSIKFETILFPDHHIYSIDDIEKMKKIYLPNGIENKIIITTEKDAVRLRKFKSELSMIPLYILPVEHQICFSGEVEMKNKISDFILSFQQNS